MRSTDRDYLNIIENPEDLVVIADPNYRIIYANRSYCRIFGDSLNDLEGQQLFTREYSTDLENIKKNLASLTPENSTASFQERLTVENETVWLDWNVKGIFDEKGELHEIVGTGRNITECKKNENVLNLFKYSLMYARVGTYWLNEAKELLYVNDYGCKMLGYSREQLIEFNWNDIIPAEYRDQPERFWQEVNEDDFMKYDIELKHKSGDKLLVEVMVHHQEFGGVNYEFVFINDICQRKLLMQKLESNEIQFRSLFENSPISLWEEDCSELKRFLDNLPSDSRKDLKSYFNKNPEIFFKCIDKVKVVRVNIKTIEMYGANSQQEFMVSLNKLFTERSAETMKDEICWLYSGNATFIGVTEQKTFNGKLMQVELTVNIVPGHEEDWSKVYVAIVDITEYKKVERELRKHRDNLAQLVEEKTAEIRKKYDKLGYQYNIMVNREFRIKELREEIKALKSRLDIIENSD